jgi:hypothetical protein
MPLGWLPQSASTRGRRVARSGMIHRCRVCHDRGRRRRAAARLPPLRSAGGKLLPYGLGDAARLPPFIARRPFTVRQETSSCPTSVRTWLPATSPKRRALPAQWAVGRQLVCRHPDRQETSSCPTTLGTWQTPRRLDPARRAERPAPGRRSRRHAPARRNEESRLRQRGRRRATRAVDSSFAGD